MEFKAKWIRPVRDMGEVCPVFFKEWDEDKEVVKAELFLTALGTYEAYINDKRISSYVLAPGWTVYRKRLQYQQYDITDCIKEKNRLEVVVGKGWFRSRMPGWVDSEDKRQRMAQSLGLFGELHLTYKDGSTAVTATDAGWNCEESAVRFSEIYDGETYDARFTGTERTLVEEFDWPTDILIPQEGEEIREQERVAAKSILHTPAGETVVDFGQEVTGYVEFTIEAHAGDQIQISHGEILDADGNFYNKNYRSARAELKYTCREGKQTWHPVLTFFGFRYLKIEQFPGEPRVDQFTAIAVYSQLKQTGYLRSSNPELNQLFSNVLWGQRGNFLDVPTDCPQRDERLGWTGDAQAFVKTASYNFDVEKFFTKWLRDLAADQREDGSVGQVIPDYLPDEKPSAAWGDAAVICPWQIYCTYGNSQILREQFPSMKKWVDYITNATKDACLWTGGTHFGDWLGLDAPVGSYMGSSREDFIASAFYAYSTKLLIKAGKVLNEDMSAYEKLYQDIQETFNAKYPVYQTQTEYILAIWFELAVNPQKSADELAEKIKRDGYQLKTGFVGTPYILHVLSRYGYTDLAYKLLLRREAPSWLYPITKGATTIWEHWDGIMENGEVWSDDMNSFNHYAYGAVADWVYEEAAGIHMIEENPGFEKVYIAPRTGRQLEWLEAELETRHGRIFSRWSMEGDKVKYEIETEMPAVINIEGATTEAPAGKYVFWGKLK